MGQEYAWARGAIETLLRTRIEVLLRDLPAADYFLLDAMRIHGELVCVGCTVEWDFACTGGAEFAMLVWGDGLISVKSGGDWTELRGPDEGRPKLRLVVGSDGREEAPERGRPDPWVCAPTAWCGDE